MESNSSTATSREIISKTMHDAAFNIAYNCINPIKVEYGNRSADETSNYVEMKRVFDFVDFDYLEGLFEKGGIIDYAKRNTDEQIEAKAEKVKEGYNREQLRKAGNKFKTEVRKIVDESNKSFDEIAIVIKVLRGLIPYNRMLISSDGYLIPLNTKYFRVDPIDLGFKYGGEIICVGMITNIIGEDTNPNDDKNVFATLQFTANEVLRRILPGKMILKISSQYVFDYQKRIYLPEQYAATFWERRISLPEYVGKGYGTFWKWKGRYRVCKGSRASKKSKTTALWYIVNMMKYPDANLLVVRKVFRTLKDSCFTKLKWAINRLGVQNHWEIKESPLEMTYRPTGQKIYFRGLDDPLKVTSITVEHGYLCWMWIEEAYEVGNENDFNMLDESIRGAIPPETGLFKQITLTSTRGMNTTG